MNRIRQLRKEMNLTQKEIADIVGISQNNFSYWENGKVKIDNESLSRLAQLFNVSIDYLLGYSDERTSQPIPDAKLKDEVLFLAREIQELDENNLKTLKTIIEALRNSK